MSAIPPGGWSHKTHFHLGPKNKPCQHIVRAHGSRASVPCAKPLSYHLHRFYTCPERGCSWRGYSLEKRILHVEKEHPCPAE